VRLVFCDGNRLLCEALAAALEERGHQALAVTSSADDVLSAVKKHKPDLCILDPGVSGLAGGLAAARDIRRDYPETEILGLSGTADPRILSEARKAGFAGFLFKDKNIRQIADALDLIAAGGVVFDRPRRMASLQPTRRHGWVPYQLTPREKEVLRRLVAGQTTRQMADEMQIEVSTLRTYVKNLLTKLGAHTRLQAAAVAVREDLLSERFSASA
jgi:two-component system, NarL family, nitrate/nitrite response regulator NarL